jgi:hypothetical protein
VIRDDPGLPLPEPASLTGPLGPLDHELAEAGRCEEDVSFSLAGLQACVAGGVRRGLDEAWAGGVRVARGLGIIGLDCAASMISPLGVERRLVGEDFAVVERLAVPRDAGFVVMEWQSDGRAAELELTWIGDLALAGSPDASASAARPVRYRRGRQVVSVERSGARAALLFAGHPDEIRVDAGDLATGPLRVRARIRIPADGNTRLVLAGGRDEVELTRAVHAARRGGSIVAARRGLLARLRDDRISLASPEPDADQSVERAKIRLAGPSGCRGREPAVVPAVRRALDALLAGDPDAARQVLRRLGREPRAGRPIERLHHVLLAGRYLAWTGDLVTVRSEWPAILSAWRAARDGEAGAGLEAAALEGLLHAAEAVGDAATAQDLRRAGGSARQKPIPSGTAGAHGPEDPALARLHAIMGVDPDATRGRLVLRPRAPDGWDRFRIRALTVGEAAVTLEYAREDRIHRFAIEQTRGAVPLHLVLEPELPGPLGQARVDGAVATLTATAAAGDRVRVPVQLALDHRRVVELETAETKDARR